MTAIPDITIIGGGAIGLMTARAFIDAGACVTIIERNVLGQESSWAGGGILLPLYPWRQAPAISELVSHSLAIYPQLAAELLRNTGIDPELHRCGLLISKNPDAALAKSWCQRYQISHADADDGFFAHLITEPEQPLWLPDIAHVRNPRLLKALAQELADKGCRIHERCQPLAAQLGGQRISRLDSSAGPMAIGHLVIAGGAWSGRIFHELLPALPRPPDIRPIKGQMLLYDAAPDTLPFMVLDGNHYLIPRRDGKILAGSTVEAVGFDKTTSAAAKDELHAFACRLLPSLSRHPLALHWAGLRPGTGQGIPYIGLHPTIGNLSINAGHFRNGLVMGPASAQLLVDLVLGRPPAVCAHPYQFDQPH